MKQEYIFRASYSVDGTQRPDQEKFFMTETSAWRWLEEKGVLHIGDTGWSDVDKIEVESK